MRKTYLWLYLVCMVKDMGRSEQARVCHWPLKPFAMSSPLLLFLKPGLSTLGQ